MEGKPEDLAKIDNDAFRETLAHHHGVDLMGAVDEATYREVKAVEGRLRTASQDLLSWPRNLPDGTWIPRPELDQLLNVIETNDFSTTALLGGPGSGKSALLAQLGVAVSDEKWPTLAIKADLLDPAIQTEKDLQDDLGLPGLPGDLLLRIAALRPVVLIIDQLDALAAYVDLRTGRLSVLLNLVRKLGRRRNVHIVLSARTFEFEHDVRLRHVQADSITLDLPTWPTLLALLKAQGVQAAGWPTDAQNVMRFPQALATFLNLRDRAAAPPFSTYQAVLNQLWQERILQRADGAQLSRLVSDIAETMAEKETQWLAAARFDDHAAELKTLQASGILTPYGVGGSIGFSHQTLFEHALARGFAQGRIRLSAYVLEREASLFIRPKLWAALTYLRDVEPVTYETELNTIWSSPNLRVHLRHLLIEFIGQQTAPSDAEAVLMASALPPGPDREVALRGVVGSPRWFDRLGSGFIAPAMTDSPAIANFIAGILSRAWNFEGAGDRVVSMMQSRWKPDPTFDGYSWGVLQDCPVWTQEVADFAVTILSRTDIAPLNIDYTVATVGVDQPMFALTVVLAKLDRELAKAEAESRRRLEMPKRANESLDSKLAWNFASSPTVPLTKMVENGHDWDSLGALAEKHPETTLKTLWPWFQRVFAALRAAEGPRDGFWGFATSFDLDFRFEGEHSLGLPAVPLLGTLRTAAEGYAAADPDGFLAWLDAHEHEASTPAQRLFAHTLASQPERFAGRALRFLLDNTNRLHIGNMEDYSSTAKRLVRNVSPFWREEELRRFEQFVLAYSPPRRPDPEAAKSRQTLLRILRQTRLGFLRALPQEKVSEKVKRYIAEERRAFPEDRIGVTYSGGGFIGSPMSAQTFSRAGDDEVINAFKKLPDATEWHHPSSWMTGGNIQLSREFATFAKEVPERARRLIGRLDPAFGTRAAGYALEAMAETAEPTLIIDLVSRPR